MRKREMIELIAGLREDLSRLQKRVSYNYDHQRKELCNGMQSVPSIKQLQCTVKGHKFVFDKKQQNGWYVILDTLNSKKGDVYKYQFKCSECGLTITKTEKELIQKEKTALKNLGLL